MHFSLSADCISRGEIVAFCRREKDRKAKRQLKFTTFLNAMMTILFFSVLKENEDSAWIYGHLWWVKFVTKQFFFFSFHFGLYQIPNKTLKMLCVKFGLNTILTLQKNIYLHQTKQCPRSDSSVACVLRILMRLLIWHWHIRPCFHGICRQGDLASC